MSEEEIRSHKIEWQGLTYDSQLEADWACTLESWGIKAKHHPGSFTLPHGLGRYEPDFLLENGVLAEVKGPSDDRLWKPEEAAKETGLPVVILRPGLVIPGTDNESAGATWHGTRLWGLEWVVVFAKPGVGGTWFTQEPEQGDDIRVSAERTVPRPAATGLGMRKAIGRRVG